MSAFARKYERGDVQCFPTLSDIKCRAFVLSQIQREWRNLQRRKVALRVGIAVSVSLMKSLMKIVWNVLIFIIAASMSAQDAPTFSAKVNVVSLLATVRDHDGRIVKDLTADDFVLEDNGRRQRIRYFSQEADLPLTIGLLVDTSRSQTGVLEGESRASYTFLDQVLREGKDQAFVVHFDERVETLQGLTSSRSQLKSALDKLSIPANRATLIYSAIHDSSENIMKEHQGRKAIILLTDGVAYKDPISLETAIEFAQRAGVIIYSIRFSGPVQFRSPLRTAALAGMKERGKTDLERMSKETGGTSYDVTKDQTIEQIYSKIEEALRYQYSIGYTPEQSATDGKYHKIELTTPDRHLIAETRRGYYAQKQ
jgi:VWFA-related protein